MVPQAGQTWTFAVTLTLIGRPVLSYTGRPFSSTLSTVLTTAVLVARPLRDTPSKPTCSSERPIQSDSHLAWLRPRTYHSAPWGLGHAFRVWTTLPAASLGSGTTSS